MTPRRVRVVRATTLRGTQQVLAALIAGRQATTARERLVLVPSRAAARTLQQTIEHLVLVQPWQPSSADAARLGIEWPASSEAIVWPDMVTRAQLYSLLQAFAGLDLAAPLSAIERDVLMRAAAADADRAQAPAPFPLRPGIIGSMRELYETCERLRVSVDDFERHLATPLERVADTDAGAARLLEQTRFLAAAFRAYAARVAASGGLDEAALRTALLAVPAAGPRHLVVATGDAWSESGGLWPVDFEFLLQRDGIEAIDIVATSTQLDAGLRERLQARVHDIDELHLRDLDEPLPVLVVPQRPAASLGVPASPCFVSRDREEELADAAARLKTRAFHAAGPETPVVMPSAAFVYRRPLPYLYLARRVLADAGIAYHAEDALPLAGEPAAAALDLLGECVGRDFERDTLVALLRSPHFDFAAPGHPYRGADVWALSQLLQGAGFVRGREALVRVLDAIDTNPAEAGSHGSGGHRAVGAVVAAVVAAAGRMATELPAGGTGPVSAHVGDLAAAFGRHQRTRRADSPFVERWRRGHAALVSLLDALATAHARHGDDVVDWSDAMTLVRRAIEARTFTPRVGADGVHLADAAAARFGRYDEVHLLGLVEGEWNESSLRTIFYPNSLLGDLNWPKEDDRIRAARATFLDVARLARSRTTLSTVTLEEDALVRPSILIDDLDQARLAIVPLEPLPPALTRTTDALAHGLASVAGAVAPAWLAWRTTRGPITTPDYRGMAGPYARRRLSATQIDAYRACPFKYFASRVLRLEEPPRDDSTLDPRRRGEFVHETLRRIVDDWAPGPVTAVTWEVARRRAVQIVDEALATLAPRDRPVERARLLGSTSREGLVDVVLALEASAAATVVRRHTEQRLSASQDGEDAAAGPWQLVGQVDRIDELADGHLRVIDYKTGRLDDAGKWLQLPMYVALVEAARRESGGHETVSEAYYVGGRSVPPLVSLLSSARRRASVVPDALLEARRVVAAIAAGEFPPRPSPESLCRTCAFALVCRREFDDVDRPAPQDDEPAVPA